MELTNVQNTLSNLRVKDLFGRSDVVAGLGLAAILLIMIIPLPSIILDLFLSMNITIALLILIISLYTVKATDFSIFPSILLTTTLFRLALNVALLLSIAVELVSSQEGLGALIWFAWETLRTEDLYVGIAVAALLGISFNFLLRLAAHYLAPWRDA